MVPHNCGRHWNNTTGYLDMYGKFQERDFPRNQIKYLCKTLSSKESFKQCHLRVCSYEFFLDAEDVVLYFDPPYEGTVGYHVNRHHAFDHVNFWENVRALSKKNFVFVSEMKAPADFVAVTSYTKNRRWEHLFVHGGSKAHNMAKL